MFNMMRKFGLELILAFAVFVSAEDVHSSCECRLYIRDDEGHFVRDNNLVMAFQWVSDDIQCNDWQGVLACLNYCMSQFNSTTNNGDLNYVLPDLNVPVGEMYCRFLGRDISEDGGEPVGLFTKVCQNEDFVFTGVTTKQNLCCKSGKHMKCNNRFSFPQLRY